MSPEWAKKAFHESVLAEILQESLSAPRQPRVFTPC